MASLDPPKGKKKNSSQKSPKKTLDMGLKSIFQLKHGLRMAVLFLWNLVENN